MKKEDMSDTQQTMNEKLLDTNRRGRGGLGGRVAKSICALFVRVVYFIRSRIASVARSSIVHLAAALAVDAHDRSRGNLLSSFGVDLLVMDRVIRRASTPLRARWT